MAKKLEFGRQPPKGTKVAWGARAIFKPVEQKPMVDILWDRQDAFGPKQEREELVEWVRMTGLPNIERQIDENLHYGISRSHDVWKYRDIKHGIEASPQGSGGYLYIGAWKV